MRGSKLMLVRLWLSMLRIHPTTTSIIIIIIINVNFFHYSEDLVWLIFRVANAK
jgi:hypothetical protein